MFEVLPMTAGPRVAIRLRDDLTEDELLDMRAYLVGLLTHHPSLRLLFDTEGWTGWDGWRALWRDVKADVRLNRSVERLAMVGKGRLDRLATEAMKPFAHAEARWFPASQLEKAWIWLAEG